MGARIIPETANRQDWPRLVARRVNEHDREIAALQAGGGGGSGTFDLDDGTATAGGVFTFDDGGA